MREDLLVRLSLTCHVKNIGLIAEGCPSFFVPRRFPHPLFGQLQMDMSISESTECPAHQLLTSIGVRQTSELNIHIEGVQTNDRGAGGYSVEDRAQEESGCTRALLTLTGCGTTAYAPPPSAVFEVESGSRDATLSTNRVVHHGSAIVSLIMSH